MPSPKELAKALARQDSVTKQPRNRFLGAIADAAGYVSDQADRYVVPERDPLFGGMRGGDLLPLRNVNRLLDDLSYGGRITTGRGQTTTLRPEVVDTVALGGMLKNPVKLAGIAALKNAAKQIHTGTGVLGSKVMNPKMSAVPEGITSRQVRELIDKNSPGESLDFDALRSAIGGNSYKLTDYDIGKINFGDLSVDASKAMPSKGPIVIGKDGKIIDGRHRAALAKSMGDSHIKAYVPVGDNVGGAMIHRPTGLLGHPKLNVLPNERVALVEGNSNLRVEHKPDGTFTISHSPAWGETGKPFTLNGDSVDDLISTAESRLKRSEVAMTAAAKSKHSKTVGGMLEMKHGDNFEYAKSARSDSQYITHTPTGAKIRISDHKLPDVYESPNFEVSGALSKKEQAQSISKFLDDYVTQRAKDDASIDVGGAMMHRPKTEFEILHDTAQRNAALPVEQGGLGLPANNTYIDRANAPGMFPTDAYHATNVEFDSFDPSKTKFVNGVFSSTDPSGASAYVEAKNAGLPTKHEGGFVMPLRINNEKSVTPEYFNLNNIRSGLAEGNNVVGGDVVVIPDAKNIRSRFAAFDPMRRHEADILAGVGVGGMLDPQAIAEALRQQDRK